MSVSRCCLSTLSLQRIAYAKDKSNFIAKEDGTYTKDAQKKGLFSMSSKLAFVHTRHARRR